MRPLTPDMELIRAFIGDELHGYYFAKLKHYLSFGYPIIGFDWKAGIFGFWWFAYLKIWWVAGPYVALLLAAQYVLEPHAFRTFAIALFSGERAIALFWGTHIYGWWVKREVSQILTRFTDRDIAMSHACLRGGTMSETVLPSLRAK